MDVGSAVAAKAGADAPGGGISLCFCRRGCAAPAQLAATLNVPPRSTPCRYGHCRRNRSPLPQRKLVSDADLVAATALQAKPFSLAATENRIGRGPRCRYDHCRRAILSCSSDDAASIRKSGLEIKNRCTPEGINRQNLASIPKSGLEIKNRCMQQAIFSTRSLDESLWR